MPDAIGRHEIIRFYQLKFEAVEFIEFSRLEHGTNLSCARPGKRAVRQRTRRALYAW